MKDLKLRQHCERRLKALMQERASWDQHWRECSDYVLPRRGRFIHTTNQADRGRKLNSKIINSAGTIAARTLSAGLMSGITSPARPWFRLTVDDKALMDSPAVKAWLEDSQDVLLRIFSASNFYNAMGVAYEELGVFGTTAMLVLEDFEDVARFYTLTIGEYYLAASHRGVVDTLYREFPMTIAALVAEFGLDNVTVNSQRAFNEGRLDHEVMVIHAIEPNDKRVVKAPDARNMPWRSVHYEKAANQGELLRVGGYRRFCAMCPRWHVTGNDVYGRSPGMDALPDVRALQSMERDKARAIALSVKPPMTAPPALRNEAHGIVPGSVTYTSMGSDGKPTFRPIFEVNPRINELMLDIQAKEQQVKDAFYASLFLMISQLDDVRSATEINERREEKLLQLGPVLERLHDELLDPLIQRVIEICDSSATATHSILPPRPRELQGKNIEIEYVSTLSVAQRSTGTASIERLIAFAGRVGAAKPDVLDKIDEDQAVEVYADLLMVPSKIVVPQEIVEKRRQARAQQAAQQKAVEQSLAMVQGAKVASEIDVGGGRNAVQALMGN